MTDIIDKGDKVMVQTKIEITEAKRKKIEALFRQGKTAAMICHSAGMTAVAQLLDDLANVAREYLKEMK